MSAWEQLSTAEEDDVWKRFQAQFRFRPSVHAKDWPAILEPHPFITWAIPDPWSAPDTADLHRCALAAFRRALPAGERMVALDWQHPCFWFRPHEPVESWGLSDWGLQREPSAVVGDEDRWRIPVLPNGDYFIFLSTTLGWGWFGHPWEQTICVFGKPLLAAVAVEPPALFSKILRRG